MSYAQVITSTTLDDTSTNITYTGSGWTYHTNVESIFHLYNNSDTFSGIQGDTATLRFYGNYIEYWGNQGPWHGPCSITVDGVYQDTANSYADQDDHPILLWKSNSTLGTEPKDHELVIRVLDPSRPNVCELDRFVVNVTTATGGSGSGSSGNGSSGNGGSGSSGSNSGSSSSSSSGPPIGIIAGVAGGVAGLALLAVAFWLYSKRKSPGKKAKRLSGKGNGVAPINNGDLPSVTPDTEKAAFIMNQNRRTSSYVTPSVPPSTIPSSPPPSSVGYSYNHAGYGAGTHSPPPPHSPAPPSIGGGGGGHAPIPPHSPPPMHRPMSVVSATSAAPTVSYYSSVPPTSEAGGYPAFLPHQPPPHAPYHPQEFQQPPPTHNVTPVWATPADQPVTQQQQHHQQSMVSGTSTTSQIQTQPVDKFPSEKAQFSGSSYPPEKAHYSGATFATSGGSSSQAGASGSGSGSGSGAGANQAVSGTHSQDIMNPPIGEAPPPAYQL
ncbi:hypothetical protein FRC15_010860 [Serendipita sp. 397]|nr:hypothetical protein FRC15_010860 [Serendipita sp. 397]